MCLTEAQGWPGPLLFRPFSPHIGPLATLALRHKKRTMRQQCKCCILLLVVGIRTRAISREFLNTKF